MFEPYESDPTSLALLAPPLGWGGDGALLTPCRSGPTPPGHFVAPPETQSFGGGRRGPSGFPPAPPASPDRAPRILLVDDDATVLDVLARTILKLGYGVEPYSSPTAALAAFQAHPEAFDLLFTDQMMPELTGLELIDRVRAARDDLPTLMTTGRPDLLSSESLRRRGCTLLPKPSSAKEIDAAILRRLSSPA